MNQFCHDAILALVVNPLTPRFSGPRSGPAATVGQASAELYSANEEFREAVTQIAALDASPLAAAYAAEIAALPPGQRRNALLNLLQLSVIYNLDLEPCQRECGGSICAPDPGFRRPAPIRLRPRYPLALSKARAGAGRSFQLE